MLSGTASARELTLEEALQENKALKEELAALRAKKSKQAIREISHSKSATAPLALPTIKGEPVSSISLTWSGFYAGLNAGYNFGTNSNVYSQNWGTWIPNGTLAPIVSIAPISMNGVRGNTQSGFIGGAQFGYNYQMGSYLIGVETDIQGTSTRGSTRTGGFLNGGQLFAGTTDAGNVVYTKSETAIGTTVVQDGLDYLGTLRGRLGYLITPTILVYGTGGLAYGGAWANVSQTAVNKLTGNNIVPTASSFGPFFTRYDGGGQQNQLLAGWTAGGGAEWMFMPNWTLKGEALYWDLGRMSVQTSAYQTLSEPNIIAWGSTSVNYSGVQAKVGVNYHFNFANVAPVVAKF
jgi:outer membrane immunogenic protein